MSPTDDDDDVDEDDDGDSHATDDSMFEGMEDMEKIDYLADEPEKKPRGMPDITPEKKHKKRKPDKLWTPKKEALLCTLWEEEDHLYDSKSDKYKDGDLRRKAMKRFSAALDIPVEKIIKRMKSLRDVYNKNTKPKPTGSGNKPMSETNKRIVQMCDFLKFHVTSRPSKSNLKKLEEEFEVTKYFSSTLKVVYAQIQVVYAVKNLEIFSSKVLQYSKGNFFLSLNFIKSDFLQIFFFRPS